MQPRVIGRAAVLAVLLGSIAAPAIAASNDSIEAQVQALRQIVERQQAQLDAQKQQLATQRAELDALRGQASVPVPAPAPPAVAPDSEQQRIEALERASAQAKVAAQEAPVVRMNANRPTITSADGRSSLAVRGNVQLDMGHYDQDPAGTLANDYRRGSVGAVGLRETDAARQLSDGAYFRRARIGVEGVIARDFAYRFLVEFGGAGTEGPTRINDAYVAYTGFAPFTFQLGAFSPPANLDDGTPPEDLLFIERASPAELSRALAGADGRLGIGLRAGGSRWFGALTFTGRTVNDAEVFDSQRAVVGRLGALLATSPDYNLHFGLNGTYVIQPAQVSLTGASRYGVRFRDRPEIRIDSTRLIDTGNVEADSAYSAGVELAANWKNVLLQGENFWYGIERRDSVLANPTFGGYYVEASWIPTGESRRYVPGNAAFLAPRPRIPFDGQGGWGAWELALRYSRTDLNYHEGLAGVATPVDGVRGGDQSILTAGINWYLNTNVKLMLNYLHIDVNRLNPARPGNLTPFGPSPATPPIGVEIGQTLDVYALRSQFSF